MNCRDCEFGFPIFDKENKIICYFCSKKMVAFYLDNLPDCKDGE